jgi:pyruvate formate lyase activating enzyme
MYRIFNPGPVDKEFIGVVPMLPYGSRGNIGFETRRLYWWPAYDPDAQCFGRTLRVVDRLPTTRIVSFGKCNFACPYCKRDCQFVGDDGLPIIAEEVSVRDVAALCTGAVTRGEIVRFSGGDPVSQPALVLQLASWLHESWGHKSSIAHNGSGTEWVARLLPHLSSAAIDVKAPVGQLADIAGIPAKTAAMFYRKATETAAVVSGAGVPLNLRTPVFAHTTLDDLSGIVADCLRAGVDQRHSMYELRMYKEVEGCSWSAPTREYTLQLARQISRSYPDLWVGVRAKWTATGMELFRAGACGGVSGVRDAEGREFGSGNRIAPRERTPVAEA